MIPSLLKLFGFRTGPVTTAVPTVEGLEYTLPSNRLHFTIPKQSMEHTLPGNKLHWTIDNEDD